MSKTTLGGAACVATLLVGLGLPGGAAAGYALGPLSPKSAGGLLEDGFIAAAEGGGVAPQAVTFRGCIPAGSFRTITHRVTLPAFGSFLHRVVPDRRGFNVVMTIDYPGLERRVNQAGPGRAESFTVRTPFRRVTGQVRISGLRGSFGCYVLRVTP